MDKATLVRSNIEIEGLVLNALSLARIPVTLCVWNYAPELQEWELVIATPWFDSKGPHQANARVLDALSVAGVYESIPIRKLVVLSPNSPIAEALEREVKAKTEGVIHIVRADQSHRTLDGQYSLMFAPFAGPGGAVPAKKISGAQELRRFLNSDVRVSSSLAEQAIDDLNHRGTASVFHVQLTNKEAKRLGLV